MLVSEGDHGSVGRDLDIEFVTEVSLAEIEHSLKSRSIVVRVLGYIILLLNVFELVLILLLFALVLLV